MPNPDNLEARIQSARLQRPSTLARAITHRAKLEADHLSRTIQQMREATTVKDPETVFDNHMRDTTARAVMVYLPQPGETGWTPASVPDFFEFNETRIRLIPGKESIALDQIGQKVSLEDMMDPAIATAASTAAHEEAMAIHRALNYAFRAGGVLIPPVGSTTELIKMHQKAMDIATREPNIKITRKNPDFGIARVYQRGTLYDQLQRIYYEIPDNLMDVGIAAIGQVTGEAIARFEEYQTTEELPSAGEIFVAARHEEEAERQRTYRSRILVARVNHLWPQ